MAKTLVIYYSRSGENYYDGAMKHLEVGNTQIAAQWIAEEAKAELFRVDTTKPYAESYKECCAQAVAEWKQNARPEVKQMPDSLEGFDTVVVGYPIWCGTMPMCLYTVLEQFDLSGKRIVALCTHEGSGFAQSMEALKELCPGAEVEAGLAIRGCQVAGSEKMIRAWAGEKL